MFLLPSAGFLLSVSPAASVSDRRTLGSDFHRESSGMSFLEKPSPGRLLLDDTVPLTAVIEASQNLQSHTVSVFWKSASLNRQQFVGLTVKRPSVVRYRNADTSPVLCLKLDVF